MTNLTLLLSYARAFEVACLSDDWSLIEPFFTENASHHVRSDGFLAMDDRGREAVVSGLRASVHGMDRRFDTRIPEIVEGPITRDGGDVWMRFRLRMRRRGLPELEFEGEHLALFEGGRIARIEEIVADDAGRDVTRFLAENEEALRPAGSAFAMPPPQDEPMAREAMMRTLVRCYAAAKSEQDIEAALQACTQDFSIDTIPFGLATRDAGDTAGQLAIFFSVFPDYRASSEGLAVTDQQLAWWGRCSMTFSGEFMGVAPTGKNADLPAFSVFDFENGLLARERFFFDLAMLCEQIGVPLESFTERLRVLRASR